MTPIRLVVVASAATIAMLATPPAPAHAAVSIKVTMPANIYVDSGTVTPPVQLIGATSNASGTVSVRRGNATCSGIMTLVGTANVVNHAVFDVPNINNQTPGARGLIFKYSGDANNPTAQTSCIKYTIKLRSTGNSSLAKSNFSAQEPIRPTVTLSNVTADASGTVEFLRAPLADPLICTVMEPNNQPGWPGWTKLPDVTVTNGKVGSLDLQPGQLGNFGYQFHYFGDDKNANMMRACYRFTVGANVQGRVFVDGGPGIAKRQGDLAEGFGNRGNQDYRCKRHL